MCVAVTGKVIKRNERDVVVDFHGNQIMARAGLVDVKEGDYVLVHAGCVIQKVSKTEAKELQTFADEMGEL